MDKASFSGHIVRKFLKGRDYEKFVEEYNKNRASAVRSPREVTEKDLEVLASWKNGTIKIRELAEKHKMSPSAVLASLRIAALSKI